MGGLTVPARSLAVMAVPLLMAAASQAVAQQSNGSDNGAVVLEAFPVPESLEIDLDGRIEESTWQSATPITDFTQQEPVEGGTPSQETEIRVVFDEDNLYIGAIFYDDPDGIIAYQRQRDASLGTDDRFMWILDTFRDGRTGYFFEINPAGLMGDGLLSGGGRGGRRPGRRRRLRGRQGVGRDLGGQNGPPGRRLVRGDPHPLQDPQLQPGSGQLGDQLPAHDPPLQRGDTVARDTAATKGSGGRSTRASSRD